MASQIILSAKASGRNKDIEASLMFNNQSFVSVELKDTRNFENNSFKNESQKLLGEYVFKQANNIKAAALAGMKFQQSYNIDELEAKNEYLYEIVKKMKINESSGFSDTYRFYDINGKEIPTMQQFEIEYPYNDNLSCAFIYGVIKTNGQTLDIDENNTFINIPGLNNTSKPQIKKVDNNTYKLIDFVNFNNVSIVNLDLEFDVDNQVFNWHYEAISVDE